MNGYTKLFGTIVGSTVWELDPEVRVVWITMLAISNQHGEVMCSVPGLAKFAGVPRAAADRALGTFLAPDPDSRTKDHEGRRIVEIDGGWRLLNHAKYRNALSAEERRERDAERKREARASVQACPDLSAPVQTCPQPSAPVRDVTAGPAVSSHVSHTEAEADPKADPNPLPISGGGSVVELPKREFGDVTAADIRYRAAYEMGLRDVLPNFSLVWGYGSQGILNRAIQAHGKSSKTGLPLRSEELLGWIRAAAGDFADVLKKEPDKMQFYSDGETKGFARWLNRDSAATEARRIDGVRGR